jgi:hypothetical protein
MRIAHTLCLAVASALAVSAAPAVANDTPRGDVTLTQSAGDVRVDVGGKPFTVYHFEGSDTDPLVRPFFFPVLAPDGTELTSDQQTAPPVNGKKPDHPHHRSVYVSHGDVNGADHWSFEQKPNARQRHVKFDRLEGDTLVEQLEWEGKGRAAPILRERRTVRFFALADGTRGMDVTSAFTPTAGSVTFGDTKEAGIAAVRVAKEISDKPTLTNAAGGKGEKDVWGKPAEWCDLSGRIGGKPFGVAILDHPKNPRHPATWHAREYGLLASNIFGLSYFDPGKHAKGSGDFTIKSGDTVTFRHRILFHPGDATAANLDQRYKEFANEAAAAGE